MKVPTLTTPRTQRPSTVQRQYASGANSIAESGAALGRAVSQLGVMFEQRKKQAEKFDVSRLAIEESMQLQQDLHQRELAAPLGAEGFTQTVLADYGARHEGVMARMREQGFSEDALQDMELRLTQLRSGVLNRALTFQDGSYRAKVGVDAQNMSTSLSQIVGMNPYEVNEAIAEFDAAVDEIPNLSATDAQALKNSNASAIRMAAGMGLAQQEPEAVVRALAGEGTVRQIQSGQRRLPISADLDTVLTAASGATGVEVEVYSGGQPSREEVAEAARTGRSLPASRPKGASDRHDHGHAADVTLKMNGRVLDYNNPQDLPHIQKFIRIAIGGGATGIGAGPGYMGKNIHIGFGQRGAKGGPVEVWGAGGKGENAPQWLKDAVAGAVAEPQVFPTDGQTGNIVLDNLSMQERMQILGQARSAMSQQQASNRAYYDNMLTNAETAYLTTGEYEGPLPSRQDLHAAYDPFTAENKWAALTGAKEVGEFIQGMSTQSNSELINTLAAMRPTDTTSQTFAEDYKTFQTAEKAVNNVITQRDKDPANYVMTHYPAAAEAWGDSSPEGRQAAFAQMLEIYDQLGIPEHQRVPMPDHILEGVKANFDSASPEARLSTLMNWRREMGSLYPQGLTQLAEAGMPVEAYLSGLLEESPTHSDVAANVLRGRDIIKHDLSRKPKYERVNEEFRAIMGTAQNVLNPQAAQAVNEAATALYVYNGGDPDLSDTDLFRASVRQVLGGLADNEDTGIVDMRSYWSRATESTILPPGITSTEFTNWKDGLIADDLLGYSKTGELPMYDDNRPVPPTDIVNEGVFVKVAPNQYIIKMHSDGNPLVTPRGDYYTMVLPSEVFRQTVNVGEVEID